MRMCIFTEHLFRVEMELELLTSEAGMEPYHTCLYGSTGRKVIMF